MVEELCQRSIIHIFVGQISCFQSVDHHDECQGWIWNAKYFHANRNVCGKSTYPVLRAAQIRHVTRLARGPPSVAKEAGRVHAPQSKQFGAIICSFKLKMYQNCFRPGRTPLGSLRRSPNLLIGWGRGPLPILFSL